MSETCPSDEKASLYEGIGRPYYRAIQHITKLTIYRRRSMKNVSQIDLDKIMAEACAERDAYLAAQFQALVSSIKAKLKARLKKKALLVHAH